MKIFINFSVFFLVYASPLFAQPIKILRDKDSTLNYYLAHKLELCNISDSCFAGIYNISFTLFPNGEIKEIMTSESLPQKYSDTITSIIKGVER